MDEFLPLLIVLGTALPALLAAARKFWIGRALGRDDTIKLSIDGDTLALTEVSQQDQLELVEAWLARHQKSDAPPRSELGADAERRDGGGDAR